MKVNIKMIWQLHQVKSLVDSVNLKIRSIVVMVYSTSFLSLRMKLDDVVKDKDFEQKVLENLRYARKITGKQFRVIFWNENLTNKGKIS